ncbi:tRNA pseudouridine(13) synthase TruD [Myxococcota bacterium]|nr:tRNA pseudouridine(13) synthase TruD [Myxococcota bacterium]
MTLPGSAAAPWSTAGFPGLGGHIGPEPEDFRVSEIPAYAASGEGPHFYVEVEKRGLSTGVVRDALARAAGVKPMDVGFAGRKDAVAVTRQWFSLPVPPAAPTPPDDPRAPHYRFVGDPVRHQNKLRLGHLRGNRFEIRLVGLDPEAEARLPALRNALAAGVPNYFGEQRFGRDARNIPDALAFLANPRRRVRDPDFLASVVQSVVFNTWLGARVSRGELHTVLEGDVLRKRDTGGLFVCTDVAADAPRVAAGEVDPAGPMVGAKTFAAVGAAAELEAAALATLNLTAEALATLHRFAPGTRRAARLLVEALEVTFEPPDRAVVRFTLPAGAFATVVLGELCHPTGPLRPAAPVDDAG